MDDKHTGVLLVEQHGSTVWITLNRPEKCNALSFELSVALTRACQSLKSDVSVLVLRGAGRHFCAGSDLSDLYQADRSRSQSVVQVEIAACHALAALPQLTVAILQGKCYGGGAILPLYCDLRLGISHVEFALPEVALGWTPPYGIERLFAQVSRSLAFDLLLSGRVCPDEEALERGWVHRLVDSEAEARSLIERLARIPSDTLVDTVALARLAKSITNREEDSRSFQAFLKHFDTDHARRTIAAFVEKRRVK